MFDDGMYSLHDEYITVVHGERFGVHIHYRIAASQPS